MLRIIVLKKETKRMGQWGLKLERTEENRNVGRESVNRRPLIAKLLDDVCLLLFQIRFQTILLTRPNFVHSLNANASPICFFNPKISSIPISSILSLSLPFMRTFVKSAGKFPFRCSASVSSTTSSSSSPPEINGGALANKPRRTREGENRVGGRCYAVCITDVIKITEVRAAMHNG